MSALTGWSRLPEVREHDGIYLSPESLRANSKLCRYSAFQLPTAQARTEQVAHELQVGFRKIASDPVAAHVVANDRVFVG